MVWEFVCTMPSCEGWLDWVGFSGRDSSFDFFSLACLLLDIEVRVHIERRRPSQGDGCKEKQKGTPLREINPFITMSCLHI